MYIIFQWNKIVMKHPKQRGVVGGDIYFIRQTPERPYLWDAGYCFYLMAQECASELPPAGYLLSVREGRGVGYITMLGGVGYITMLGGRCWSYNHVGREVLVI